jgi:hypothetical protein
MLTAESAKSAEKSFGLLSSALSGISAVNPPKK